jgi:hypothetical protein
MTLKPYTASQEIGITGVIDGGRMILNFPPSGIGATIFIPTVKVILSETALLDGLKTFIVMSPGVVELTASSLELFAYKKATRHVTQFDVVAVLFWIMLTLKLEDVPMNLGFRKPFNVKSINPWGFSI